MNIAVKNRDYKPHTVESQLKVQTRESVDLWVYKGNYGVHELLPRGTFQPHERMV